MAAVPQKLAKITQQRSLRQKPLTDKQVKYLAFEGGGGKGAAYLGALGALGPENIGRLNWVPQKVTKRRVLDASKIKGVSGASAGAITALLVSCGYTINEIEGFVIASGRKGVFYDAATPLMVPIIELTRQLARRDSCSPTQIFEHGLTAAIVSALAEVGGLRDMLEEKAQGKQPLEMIASKDDFAGYLFNLFEDNGLMSGCKARATFDELIAFKTRNKRTGERIYGATFEQHYEYHEVKLVVSGTNIETGETRLFSVDETPEFRVADAVRISMSFPFVFKPVVIPEGKYKGTWIDGGLLNNIPIHAFDPPPGGIINDHVLGIRLEITESRKITDVASFFGAVLGTAFGAGEALQIRTQKEVDQSLIIDTGGLDTLDFDPERSVLQKAVSNGAKEVMFYFTGREGPINPYKRYPSETP